MKHLKTFEDIIRDRTIPEYYFDIYSKEEKEEFIHWYNIIKPCLDKQDAWCAKDLLLDWEKECIMKSDMYSLLRHTEKIFDEMKITNLSYQETKDIINNTKNFNI